MQTFFILGTHPELAKAEILSVVGLNTKVIIESQTVLILDLPDQSLEDLQNRLGGTIKIGTVIDEFQGSDPRVCTDTIIKEATNAVGKNKITFGLSTYDLGNPKAVRKITQSFKVMGGEIKNRLKETGRPVRFVMAKDESLTSVVVETNGLNESGGEFCFFATDTTIILGRTSTVQNFKTWSDRDFGRPARDSRSGMLPPKLARMMINLSGVNPTSSILLDPFCGSGTVIMESSLIGFEKIIGSDISKKAVEDSNVNTRWIYNQKFLSPITKESNIELFVCPAEKLSEIISTPVDVIVTETYLGPPRRSDERSQMEKMISELMMMYKTSLQSLEKIIKPGGVLVIAFPAFVIKNDVIRLPLKKMIESVGLTFDQSWMYRRPDQMTAREIVRMKKSG